MKEFFLNNLDYIYLFYGAAFFFLGVACLVLYSRKKTRDILPWVTLSLFGFTHGLYEWLDMLAFSFSSPKFLLLERNIMISLSYICLFEFSRRSLKILKNKKIGFWVYVPIVIFMVVFFSICECGSCIGDCVNAASRYGLAFPGAVLVGSAFWIFSNKNELLFLRRIYKVISISFFMYAVFAGLIVPKCSMCPAPLLDYSSFLRLLHVPVQCFRGLLATIISFLFIYLATKISISGVQARKGVGYIRFIFTSFVLSYFVFLCFGFYLVSKVSQYEKHNLTKIILSNARLLGKSVGELDFSNLTGISDGSTYSAKNTLISNGAYLKYRQIHARMNQLADVAYFVKSLYLISIKDGQPFFIVGSQPQVFPLAVTPSFDKRIPQKAIADAYHSKQPTIDNSYVDKYGCRFTSVFIPILSGVEGQNILLGIDLDAVKMQVQVSRVRGYAIFVVLAFLVLLVVGHAFLIVFALKRLELEVQKSNLDKALLNLKEAEAELSRSEETFRGILDNSPGAIFGFDRDLRVIFWNYGAERLYGYLKKEVVDEKNPLLSKRVVDIFGIGDMEVEVTKVFLGETLLSETAHNIKKGSIDVIMTLFPVKDPKGNILFGMGLVQDISAHKKLEFSLAEERDRLSKIATSIGAGLSLVDRDFNIIWVNETLESWFGKLDTIRGKKCYKAYQFKDTTCEGCPVKKAIQTGQMQSAETRSVFNNGKIMDFLLICSPIKNEKGEVEQILELTLDITDRKRTADLLEHERALSKDIIDSIDESLMLLDCRTKVILDVNKKFTEFCNLEKDEILGKKCYEIKSHVCPVCDGCDFVDVVENGKVIEMTHLHKDHLGKDIFVDVRLTPLRDEKGKVVGVIHLAKDVTDKKRLENEMRSYYEKLEALVKERTKALQNSETMFHTLFETAQDGILVVDFQATRVVDVNTSFLSLMECSRESVQGVDCKNVACFKEAKIFEKVFEEFNNKSSVFLQDIQIKTYTGKDVWVEILVSSYFVETKKILQFNVRDITERKKIEKIKNEFVSMVSHELRTPLSAIKEGVEIVSDGTQGELNKSQQECLNIALSNIKRLNRLIGDILDISKMQSNLLKMHIVACDVRALIEHITALVKIEMEKHGMLFIIDLDNDLPKVKADKDRLIQVFINLLNNAVKFTREKSKITLSARRTGDFVEFSVKDEGAGIPQEELSRLFGKFIQLDSTLIRRVGGTGLGLYISKNLVEAMKGHIWVESEAGDGAIFKFIIPVE